VSAGIIVFGRSKTEIFSPREWRTTVSFMEKKRWTATSVDGSFKL
jgi:hypothetical protein